MKPELIKALLKVQKELPVVERTTKAYNYKYTPLEEVWDKVGKVLTDNGFAIINQISTEGVTTYAEHEHGQLTSHIDFTHVDLKPQDRGSEITYARRYNLTAMFNIIVKDEDDDGSSAHKATTAPKSNKSTPRQLKFIRDLLKDKGYTEKQMEIKYEVANMSDLTYDQASQAIEGLKNAPINPNKKVEEDIDTDEIAEGIRKMEEGK